jgi:predicted MPP superfamily phosphohydrolase
MIVQFWAVSLFFHLALGLCTLWLAAVWVRERPWKRSARGWWVALLDTAVRFGIVLCAGALIAGVMAPPHPSAPFVVMRFLCQGLFGEGFALAVFVAWLHLRQGARSRGAVVGLVALLLLLVYVEAYHLGPHDLQVQRYALDRSGGRAGSRVLRILHLSDFQTHQIGDYEKRVIRLAREQAADLIVFTGDYIQERLAPTGPRAVRDFAALLRREGLRAPLGFFAVSGDVDPEGWEQSFTGTGATILDNRSTTIPLPGGRRLALIGLDVTTSLGREADRVTELVEAAKPEDLCLVMGHHPDFVTTLAGPRRIDLALAGHTHGGQVVVPGFGPPLTLSRLPRRYAGGLNDYQGIPLLVCRGSGMERGLAPQIRFFCPPEICVIEVRY